MTEREKRRIWCNDFPNMSGEKMPETCPDGKPHEWGPEVRSSCSPSFYWRDCGRCDVRHEIDFSG